MTKYKRNNKTHKSKKDQLTYLDLLQNNYPYNSYGGGTMPTQQMQFNSGSFWQNPTLGQNLSQNTTLGLGQNNMYNLGQNNTPKLSDTPKSNLMSGLGNTALGMGAGIVGNLGGNLIAGGKSSGIGNTIGSLGNTIGGAVMAANPLVGGAIMGGTQLIKGAFNAIGGVKLNKERIAQAENEINAVNNFNINASNFDDLASQINNAPTIAAFSRKDIGSNSLFNKGATKEYNRLNDMKNFAEAWKDRSIANAATNLQQQQINNLLQNYAAYGGLLDMNNQYSDGGKIYIKPSKRGTFTAAAKKHGKGVQEFASQVLANKENYSPAMIKKANFARNAAKWHSFGGTLSTHGLDLSNGVVQINNGNTHENNKYEGVQMGVDSQGIPNLVEQDEVIFNDYVFSNRIPVPDAVRNKYKLRGTKDMTFADAAKKAAKESEERPNDPISQRGLEDIMNKLANEQEVMREQKNSKRYGKQYATGGILGNKGNLFLGGGPYEYGQDLLNMEDYNDLSSLYKQGSNYMNKRQYIIDNWNTDYVKNWIKNTYIPSVQNYNKSRGYDSDFTVNLDQFTRGTYDNQYGGMHKGVLDFTIPEKSNNQQEVPAMTIYTTRGRRGGDISINPEALDLYGYSIPQDIIETTKDSWGNTINYLQNTTIDGRSTNTGSKKKGNKNRSNENILGGDNLLRYAPVVGSAIGLGQTLLSKPDYSRADALAQFAQNAGKITPITYEPIGNYLTYRPTDLSYQANRMAAQAGATRRNIMNTSGGNRANAIGSLLAADYNSQIAMGEAIRQAEATNFARRAQVEEFNRGTDQYNSELALKAAIANQEARMKASQLGLSGYTTAMKMKDEIDAQRNASLSANLTNLFDSLGDIGREKVIKKMVKNNPALLYDYFGRYKGNISAEGGKLNKKKRGGFTY